MLYIYIQTICFLYFEYDVLKQTSEQFIRYKPIFRFDLYLTMLLWFTADYVSSKGFDLDKCVPGPQNCFGPCKKNNTIDGFLRHLPTFTLGTYQILTILKTRNPHIGFKIICLTYSVSCYNTRSIAPQLL